MKVRWSRDAEISLYEVTEYIREVDPNAAKKVISAIREKTNYLERFPLIATLHKKFSDFREAVISNYPFVIWYRVKEQEYLVEIILIWHTSQNRESFKKAE